MARPRSDDPRYQRVRERLARTILEMAASRPAESISVSELTAAAGVSRSSFYGHATSPEALLASVLIDEITPDLTRVLAQFSDPGVDYVDLWRRAYLELLGHVRRHRAVFEIITSRESSVGSALIAHFESLTEPCVREITARLDGDTPSRLWTQLAITQHAHNMISVIRAWTLTDLTASPETVVDTYMSLAPPWQLARADDDGSISLHRSLRRSQAGERPPGDR